MQYNPPHMDKQLRTGLFSIPDPVYRDLPAVAHSDLKRWSSGEGAPRKSRHLHVGSLHHMALLQPELTEDTYVILPEDVDLRTPKGKEMLAFYEAESGKIAIKPKEVELVESMRQSVLNHPVASRIIAANGHVECTAVAELEPGVLSKGLLDKITPMAIVDLKTTQALHAADFVESVYKYGYDSQGAYYVDLYEKLFGERLPFLWVCTSKRSLGTWVQELTDDMYMTGRRWYRTTLGLYARYHTEDAE